MIAVLAGVSTAGCVWLWLATPHGVAELIAATLVLAPLMTLAMIALGVAQ